MTLEPLLWLHCSISGRFLLEYIIGTQFRSDCSQVDILGLWYKSVNVGAEISPGPPNRRAQIHRRCKVTPELHQERTGLVLRKQGFVTDIPPHFETELDYRPVEFLLLWLRVFPAPSDQFVQTLRGRGQLARLRVVPPLFRVWSWSNLEVQI